MNTMTNEVNKNDEKVINKKIQYLQNDFSILNFEIISLEILAELLGKKSIQVARRIQDERKFFKLDLEKINNYLIDHQELDQEMFNIENQNNYYSQKRFNFKNHFLTFNSKKFDPKSMNDNLDFLKSASSIINVLRQLHIESLNFKEENQTDYFKLTFQTFEFINKVVKENQVNIFKVKEDKNFLETMKIIEKELDFTSDNFKVKKFLFIESKDLKKLEDYLRNNKKMLSHISNDLTIVVESLVSDDLGFFKATNHQTKNHKEVFVEFSYLTFEALYKLFQYSKSKSVDDIYQRYPSIFRNNQKLKAQLLDENQKVLLENAKNKRVNISEKFVFSSLELVEANSEESFEVQTGFYKNVLNNNLIDNNFLENFRSIDYKSFLDLERVKNKINMTPEEKLNLDNWTVEKESFLVLVKLNSIFSSEVKEKVIYPVLFEKIKPLLKDEINLKEVKEKFLSLISYSLDLANIEAYLELSTLLTLNNDGLSSFYSNYIKVLNSLSINQEVENQLFIKELKRLPDLAYTFQKGHFQLIDEEDNKVISKDDVLKM